MSEPSIGKADRRLGRRWARRALLGVVIAFFGLLVAGQVADVRAGCGSVDPTDPDNYSEVTLLNDTSATVTVDDCEGTYCYADLPTRLLPGERLADHAACAASGADMTSWRLATDTGRVLGYIAVNTPRKRDGLVFPVSHAGSNRETPTSPI